MKMEDTKVEEGFKRCSRCGEVKPISEFYKKKSSKDGLQNNCKDCAKAVRKEHYQTHQENELKMVKEWRDKHPTYNAEYYQANKEKIAQKQACYNSDYYNPQTHPLNWARNIVANYRKMDRERGFDDSKTITAEWFLQHIANQPCVHCGVQGIGKVGCNRLDNTKGHTIDNVESCCFKCNCKENMRDQIRRGIHISQLRKKQSFKDFVKEHKAKHKNLT